MSPPTPQLPESSSTKLAPKAIFPSSQMTVRGISSGSAKIRAISSAHMMPKEKTSTDSLYSRPRYSSGYTARERERKGERQRERERERDKESEREKERERKKEKKERKKRKMSNLIAHASAVTN